MGARQSTPAQQPQALSGMAPATAPAGEWVSPISSELITSKTLKLSSPSFDEQGTLYFLEGRPMEGGRALVVSCSLPPPGSASPAEPKDVTPGPDSGMYVRTRVHEYGGGEYLVAGDSLFFSNFKDQRLYTQALGATPGAPQALTPEEGPEGSQRFADACYDGPRGRLLAVCERHPAPKPGEEEEDAKDVVNCIAAVDVKTGAVTPLASGHDFYSSPRLSPDGSRLCWLQWDFPNMPWDGTELMVADVMADGSLGPATKVAGGPEEAVQQPTWAPEGHRLLFVTDRSGWWNLYAWDAATKQVSPVHQPVAADYGFPPWTFGAQSYAPLSKRSGSVVLALYNDPARAGVTLGLLKHSPTSGPGSFVPLACGARLTAYGSPTVLAVHEDPGSGALVLAVAAACADAPLALMVMRAESVQDLERRGPQDWAVVRGSAGDLTVDPGYVSIPQSRQFPTTGGRSAYAVYYPPANKDYTLPPGEAPPLMVNSHGGPTASASVQLNLGIQYFTSRGWAYCDVNYGGSTGYGREYRNRLRGMWGVVDVDDCCAAARHLADQGLVDPGRMVITGGSAGGYTTLACIAFRDTFAAGSSLYGVADLALLAQHTHKFESRYLDLLVGPWPERQDLYDERSPLSHVEGMACPVIFFQGDEDKVVPPEQSVKMHAAVKGQNLPTALVMFEGEQHGFRKPASIRTVLDGQLMFFGKVLKPPYASAYPPDLDPITIDNL